VPSQDILVLIAELAVAVAGFSSIVVALDKRSVSEWAPGEQRNLRILLQVSAVAILFSIFPLVLQRALDAPSFWNIALSVYSLVPAADVSTFLFRPVVGESQLPPIIGLGLALLSLAVAAFGSSTLAEVTYLCVLVWHLGVAAMGFAFLIFRDRSGAA